MDGRPEGFASQRIKADLARHRSPTALEFFLWTRGWPSDRRFVILNVNGVITSGRIAFVCIGGRLFRAFSILGVSLKSKP